MRSVAFDTISGYGSWRRDVFRLAEFIFVTYCWVRPIELHLKELVVARMFERHGGRFIRKRQKHSAASRQVVACGEMIRLQDLVFPGSWWRFSCVALSVFNFRLGD